MGGGCGTVVQISIDSFLIHAAMNEALKLQDVILHWYTAHSAQPSTGKPDFGDWRFSSRLAELSRAIAESETWSFCYIVLASGSKRSPMCFVSSD